MQSLADLVGEHPWQTLAVAFLVGAAVAADRRTRNTLIRTGFDLARKMAVYRALDYAHAVERVYARA